MASPSVSIPRPCPIGQSAFAPTEAGWHCARCGTEVIDFTRLTEAEVLSYLAARTRQRVCARLAAPVLPQPPHRPPRWQRWLLAALAFAGGGSLFAHSALPPLPVSLHKPLLPKGKPATRFVVRGTVLDDSLNVPVPGAYVFIAGTKYGAVTDERGEFSFSLATNSKLAAGGRLVLQVSGSPFIFLPETVVVQLSARQPLAPLLVRLRSEPERGYVMGKVRYIAPPVAPPGSSRK